MLPRKPTALEIFGKTCFGGYPPVLGKWTALSRPVVEKAMPRMETRKSVEKISLLTRGSKKVTDHNYMP